MSTIEALFLDAERLEKQQRLSNILKNKLQRLEEAVYRADDLFDEVATVAQLKKLMHGNKVSKEVRLFFSRFNQLCSAFKMSREIREIREMLDDIKNDHPIHNFGPIQPIALEVRNNPRETHSFLCEEDVIIGRDEDKRLVIDMLCDATAVEEAVSVVSIVGIGGLGKTTLAQLVYNDDTIQREFQLKMWVCVSDDFSVQALLCKILAAATKQPSRSGLSMDQLQWNIRQQLEGKKYLLVLDDIWNEDSNKWCELRKLLIQGGRGSRIVVTTRSMKVASVVGSQQIHELKGLSDQDSWNLFKKMTLERGQTQMEEHLVDFGKEIVRKCVNVPLAIRVIGSLLQGQDDAKWRNVMKNDWAAIDQDENGGIIPVLKISYNYLQPCLKSCFTFCAIFPKDHIISKEDLIYLWMAQGFIRPSGRQSIEDVGEEYFMNLLQRCFFQDVKQSVVTGVILSCKMHDLIHDLAQEVVRIEIKSCSADMCSLNDKTHLLFIEDTIDDINNIECYLRKMKRLRTWLGPRAQCICFEGLLPQMRYLRVLDLSGRYLRVTDLSGRYLRVSDLSREYREKRNLKKLPSMIGQLVHLRYLDLSKNEELSEIPNSIVQLINLQTLKLKGCSGLKELPRELSKLVNLRQLDILGCAALWYMPPGMNRMTCLHKLTKFVVGGGSSHASCLGPVGGTVGKLEDLKYLNNLRDRIEIVIKEGRAYDEAEVKGGKYLLNKPLLKDIQIILNYDLPGDIAEALLQGLQPHPNIKRLDLWVYTGLKFPSWGDGDSLKDLNTPLPNLVNITLSQCKRLKHVPLLSQLRHLKFLELSFLEELEYVEDGAPTVSESRGALDSRPSVFFPALERLVLGSLPKLKGWWRATSPSLSTSDSESVESDIQILGFPCLSFLEIRFCSNLTTFPSLPKLESLIVGKALAYFHSLPNESFQHLTTLFIMNDLEIESLATIEVFRSGRMSFVRSLEFWSCSKLKSISGRGVWEHFTALENLQLIGLKELEFLEMEDNNDAENEIPWRCLAPSLRSLTLEILPKMGKLPMGMRHLTALRTLEIHMCDNLEDIPAWISCLASLQHLVISSCPRVKSLPEQMIDLTSLNKLKLWACSPELKERCQEQTGADWHKIKHISSIDFEARGFVQ